MNPIYKFEFVSVFWRYDALLSASGNIIPNVPGYCFTETFIPLNGNRRFRVGWVEPQTGVFMTLIITYWIIGVQIIITPTVLLPSPIIPFISVPYIVLHW